MLTTDCVVFGFAPDRGLQVLLVQRDAAPAQGAWALPGTVVREDEQAVAAAQRMLMEKAGTVPAFLEQLYTFDGPGRDPRGWVVSIAHYALVPLRDVQLHPRRGVAQWCPIEDLPELAFDHAEIIRTALVRLRGKIVYQPIGFSLLDPVFTLKELQNLYETVLNRSLDARNFRKKVLDLNVLDPAGATQLHRETLAARPGRPAQLYRFNRARYDEAERLGFVFAL